MEEQQTLQRKGPAPSADKPLKDEDWAHDLLEVVKHYDLADKSVRDRQVRKWRKQMLYWESFQFLYWSELIKDWRTPEQASDDFAGSGVSPDMDPSLYAKVVNIYRAHGEVIIAAMSTTVPKVQFPPDDADNPDDILAAKGKTKLATLIQRHNYAEIILVKALYLLFNQGLVCGYNETFESDEFGTVKIPQEGMVTKKKRSYFCPDCGTPLGGEDLGSEPMGVPGEGGEAVDPNLPPGGSQGLQSLTDGGESQVQEVEEVQPTMEPMFPEDGEEEQLPPQPGNVRPPNNMGLPPGMGQEPPQDILCPACSQDSGMEKRVQPEMEDYDEVGSAITGWDEKNKCRELLTFWGPLNVKVPSWARRIQDSPYLILETEEHYAKMQSIYPEIGKDIKPSENMERYDRSMRTATAYEGDVPRDLVTVRRAWLRPWAFNVLGVGSEDTEEKIEVLREKFPKGCYVVIINDDLMAEAVPDKLDDHWTLSVNPLSDTIHAEPLGSSLMPLQELVNELVNLTVENIEHSIPETFVDSDALDWDAYGKSEARPGMMYPVSKKPGEALGNSFYEITGGNLSKEVELFGDRLEKFSQFVVGSLPSVFGGAIEGGSNTAKEYEMSRTQALQRLATTWRLVTVFWTQVIGKAVNAYAESMLEDEKYTEDSGGGNFINVWIRQAHMKGKVGLAYSEASESLPISWNEKRSILISMMQMKSEMIDRVIADPENASFVARVVGLSELYVPGDQDRNKQIAEIGRLILEEPMEVPSQEVDPMTGMPMVDPMTGMPPMEMQSSIVPEDDLDNHEIESAVCAIWLKGEIGQDMKETKPGAYLNVLTHKRMHDKVIEMKAMKEAMMGAPPPGEEGDESEAPGDVGAIGSES